MLELNKYLKHHRLDKHLKSTKNDKVLVITRHWLFQMNPEGADLLQTGLREREEAGNEPLLDSDDDDSDEDNGGSKSRANENENNDNDSGDKDKLRVVILVFSNDEEAFERPAITHSGRANNTIAINMSSVLTTSVHKHVTARAAIVEITRRSEIDFSIFDSSTYSERAGTFLIF